MQVMAFGPGAFVEQQVAFADAVAPFLGHWPVVWLNVDGLGDAEAIRKFGEIFGIHPLALEDVINVHQRPKVEPYEKYLFIVMQMLLSGPTLGTEQLSLFLGENFVVTFQERPGGDCFAAVRDRIRKNHGRLRSSGADFLAYSLIDAVVDSYFPVLEQYGEELEAVEQEIVENPGSRTFSRIHQVKAQLLVLRRALWPIREVVNALLRDGSAFIRPETRPYVRDCYDHAVHIIDTLETYRDTASSLLDAYLSSASNRMNEIMKVLTIIATIFIPLTFIVGIYGMNFDFMPELHARWGYPAVMALMAVVAAGMLLYFRRKRWL
jgi:magnesium transporter